MNLETVHRDEDGAHALATTVWRLGAGMRGISSAMLGGGIGPVAWVINAQVPGGYARMDPVVHLGELAPERLPRPAPRPGTINIQVAVPVPMSDGALVNAVMTVTEAKTQALLEEGYPGTGTASDAVCVVAPVAGFAAQEEPFGGPRSEWGARIARAVHAAVAAGARDYTARLNARASEDRPCVRRD